MPNKKSPATAPIFSGICQLMEQSKQQVAVAVNATMSMLYWQIVKRINEEIVEKTEPNYPEKIVSTLWRLLSWS